MVNYYEILRRSRNGQSPLWNDGPESDHRPSPGLWAGCEAVNELQASTFPSLQRRGGRAIKRMVPFRKGADGVVNHK